MMRYDKIELSVCVSCLEVLANGVETTEHEQVARDMHEKWGGDERHIVPACTDECEGGFSWTSCDGCGSTLGGDRHPAVALIPDYTCND